MTGKGSAARAVAMPLELGASGKAAVREGAPRWRPRDVDDRSKSSQEDDEHSPEESAPTATEHFPDELRPGTRLLHGQYTIQSYLNSGGFGITYLAKDSLDRTVVIKECFPEAFCQRVGSNVRPRSREHQNEFRAVVRLFVQEAKSLSRLVHPHIVGVHQVFEDNDTAYMAIDYIDGRDLLDHIDDPDFRPTPELVVDFLRKLLNAVSFIHANDVLHRDISPDNILVNRKKEPILIDFGAAREQAAKRSRALSAMRIVKDGYSPQEFYVAGSTQTPSSDLYALAATFYHLITGEVPPESQVRLAAMADDSADPYVPLAGRYPGYPEGFLEAIDQAIAVLPKDRIASASEWLVLIDGPEANAADVHEVMREPETDGVAPGPRGRTGSIDHAVSRMLQAFEQTRESALPPTPPPPMAVPEPAPKNIEAERASARLSELAEFFAANRLAEDAAGEAERTRETRPDRSAAADPVIEAPASEPPGMAEPAAKWAATLPQTAPPDPHGRNPEVQTVGAASAEPQPEAASEPATGSKRRRRPIVMLAQLAALGALVAIALFSRPPSGQTDLETLPQGGGLGEVGQVALVAPAAGPPDATESAAPAGSAAVAVDAQTVAPTDRGEAALKAAAGVTRGASAGAGASKVGPAFTANWLAELPFETELRTWGDEGVVAISGLRPDASHTTTPGWMREGVAIQAVNAQPVNNSAAVAARISEVPNAGPDGRLTASLRIRTSQEAPEQLVLLTLPAERRVVLAGGVELRSRLVGETWQTRVEAVGRFVDAGLMPGDILLAERGTGQSLDGARSLELVIDRLSRERQAEAVFAVNRGGSSATAVLKLARQ